jgi:Xaa-Pro aminopeptidase
MRQAAAIPLEEFDRRLESTRRVMVERGLDGLIVLGRYPEQEGNIAYLSNFRQGFPKNLYYGGAGCHALVLGDKGLSTLVSPTGTPDDTVVNIDGNKTGTNFALELAAAIREKGLGKKKIGMAGRDLIPFEIGQALEKALAKAVFEPADDILRDLREIKSPREIDLLAHAASVGEAALAAGMDAARAGDIEIQVELVMRRAAREAGADLVARVSVNSGSKLNARSWPPVTDRILEDGDFVMAEIAGWAGGYAFSRSGVQVVGQATSEQKAHLKHLAEAVDWMVETLKPHKDLGYVLTIHREQRIMPAAHAIGLEIFEYPWIVMGPVADKPTIKPNTVMCVEPILQDSRFGSMSAKKTVFISV